jgi:hypothetical protein
MRLLEIRSAATYKRTRLSRIWRSGNRRRAPRRWWNGRPAQATPRGSQPAPSPYGCRRTVASESLPQTRGADLLSRRGVPNCRAGDAPELRGKRDGRSRVGSVPIARPLDGRTSNGGARVIAYRLQILSSVDVASRAQVRAFDLRAAAERAAGAGVAGRAVQQLEPVPTRPEGRRLGAGRGTWPPVWAPIRRRGRSSG